MDEVTMGLQRYIEKKRLEGKIISDIKTGKIKMKQTIKKIPRIKEKKEKSKGFLNKRVQARDLLRKQPRSTYTIRI